MDEILQALLRGEISLETARQKLDVLQIKRIGEVARLDINRARRTGAPGAILAQDKATEDVCRLTLAMAEASGCTTGNQGLGQRSGRPGK